MTEWNLLSVLDYGLLHFVRNDAVGFCHCERFVRISWQSIIMRFLKKIHCKDFFMQDYGLLRHFIPRNDAMVESSVCFYGLPRFLAESRNDGVGL